MWHPSKAYLTMPEILAIHTMNKADAVPDATLYLNNPVNVGGFLGEKFNIDLSAQTVAEQRGSGVMTQLWTTFGGASAR